MFEGVRARGRVYVIHLGECDNVRCCCGCMIVVVVSLQHQGMNENVLLLQATEKAVRELFEQKGTVTDCSLKYTADGKFRRFAFIGFSSNEEAEAAQKYFHNTYMNTTKIHVSLSVLMFVVKSSLLYGKDLEVKTV